MNPLAMIVLSIMLILAVVFIVGAAVLWIAGKRIEVRIRELDSQLGSSGLGQSSRD